MLCLYTPNVHIHGINSSKYGQTRLELVSLIFVVVSMKRRIRIGCLAKQKSGHEIPSKKSEVLS